MHSSERDFSCDVCEKKFKRLVDVSGHKTRIHSIQEKHSCQVCFKLLKTRATLHLHMAVHQSADKRVPCDKCDKTFSLTASLTVHKREVHLGVEKFQCDKCDYKSKRKYEVKLHQAVHQGDPKLACKMCPKIFSTEGSCKTHMQKFHQENGTTVT